MIRPALFALACSALAVPAMAQAQHARIRYADLDLASSAGRATLDKRIDAAARTACADLFETGSLAGNARIARECRADVRAQAEAHVASLLS